MGKGSDGLNGKVEFWAAAMELHEQSGLSCVEFCNREGLAYSTFCRWRDKLSGKVESAGDNPSSEDMPEAAEDANAEASEDEVKFVAAGVIEPCGAHEPHIEIRFSSGISVNVRKGFDRSTFKAVVSILGAAL